MFQGLFFAFLLWREDALGKRLVKCKSHFSVFDDITKWFVIFFNFLLFFNILLIFLRRKDNFWYLRLILVCLTMGGGFEQFFGTRYHMFPRVTIHVVTDVTILLWEFYTISNALLLLYISYNMPYYAIHFQ